MKGHFVFDDTEFELQFENGTLSPKLFSHEAHLRLAWIELRRLGESAAVDSVCDLIRNYVIALGVKEKFNLTITVAAVKMVNHFMQRSEAETFEALLEAFPVIGEDFKGLMRQHYSFDIYHNAEARKTFLSPDLAPFD